MTSPSLPQGVEIKAVPVAGAEQILTKEALVFIAKLERSARHRRKELLHRREIRQAEFDAGKLPDFLPETKNIRELSWQCAPIPKDLLNRRVEITGPTDRKMIINALNCGADVYMADFEDSNSPTWSNLIQGQFNLQDAVSGTITFNSPEGKFYKLNKKTATLLVRPRGWHLDEKHVLVDGEPVSASLFDFSLFFFHNARKLIEKGTGPYFYLPKMESHLEARLWNDVFLLAQKELRIPSGTIRATVLIETILAAFEMDEILYELKDHISGLNCGRWDYIFSFIKKFRNRPDFVLPDRSLVGMTTHFLRSYSQLLVQTCHKRGVHAMGGMAAQIPIKSDPKANEEALEKVRADKIREVADGHDGTWVAHPDLVPLARQIFDERMIGENQIASTRPEVSVSAKDLLSVPQGEITEKGLRTNIDVGIRYLEAWLRGSGCVPIYNLMEDAATVEISRAQIWQWLRHKSRLSDGREISRDLFQNILRSEAEKLEPKKFKRALDLFQQMAGGSSFTEFLTVEAYKELL